jgi:hypothetical protein
VLSKKLMIKKGSLDNMNLFQIITIMAFFMLMPVQLLIEGGPFLPHRIAELVGGGEGLGGGGRLAAGAAGGGGQLRQLGGAAAAAQRAARARRARFAQHRAFLTPAAPPVPRPQYNLQGLTDEGLLLLAQRLLGAGLCFHAYQQLSYMILSKAGPLGFLLLGKRACLCAPPPLADRSAPTLEMECTRALPPGGFQKAFCHRAPPSPDPAPPAPRRPPPTARPPPAR